MLRRHRLIELFLVERMGMDWSEVHAEAERLEHAVSERLIASMDEMLGRPVVDPHGDPTPDVHGRVAVEARPNLLTCPVGASQKVARVEDQSAEFLRLVERAGLRPGRRVRVEARDPAADLVRLRLGRGMLVELGSDAAVKILVEPG